jgi:hypothetical protein
VEKKDAADGLKARLDPHHAQESTDRSSTPAGTAGVAGWPEHHAPEHGRGVDGTGCGSDGSLSSPDRSRIRGSIRPTRCPGSVRDVTRCEHPACTPEGAYRRIPRSNKTAPEGRGASLPNRKNLVMRWISRIESDWLPVSE